MNITRIVTNSNDRIYINHDYQKILKPASGHVFANNQNNTSFIG